MTVRRRVALGRLKIDRMTFAGALEAIGELVESRRGGMVFTPNVDHVVVAESDARFRLAYEAADICLADGMPVVWATHALGAPVPEKVSGSDLVWPLLDLAEERAWRVYLLGGEEGVASTAARRACSRLPLLQIAGVSSPRIDMSEPSSARDAAIADVRRTRPDLVFVGLGAPKQELFIHEALPALRPAVMLGVGASIDFLAGSARRAPAWVSRAGMEWLHRLAMDPKRLWRRYLLRDPEFAGILLRDLIARRRERGDAAEARR